MRRWRWGVLGLLALALALWAKGYFFPRAAHLTLPQLGAVPSPVLVFAPHSDDESLATGGLIQQVQRGGGRAAVVLVTGGDGFTIAAEAQSHHRRLTGEQMVAFGRHRLTESRDALGALGMPPDRLHFLGFGDHTLHHLWMDCWAESKPCTSPTTKSSKVPYAEALKPGAPYAGRALLAQIVTLLRQERPAAVAYPHPNEAHVDHWALSNFVSAALEEVRRTEPGWKPPQEYLYLVHRGDWPAPKGLRPTASLLPPAPLATGMTTWHSLPLGVQDLYQKGKAVRQYRSQVTILRRFMDSFVRSNELFGRVERVRIGQAATTSTDGPPWPGQWIQMATDPAADTLARTFEKGADLRAVWATVVNGELQVAVKLGAPPRGQTNLRLYARAYRTDGGWGDLAKVAERDRNDAWVRGSLPLGSMGAPTAVSLSAEAWIDGALVDRTAWRIGSLDGQ